MIHHRGIAGSHSTYIYETSIWRIEYGQTPIPYSLFALYDTIEFWAYSKFHLIFASFYFPLSEEAWKMQFQNNIWQYVMKYLSLDKFFNSIMELESSNSLIHGDAESIHVPMMSNVFMMRYVGWHYRFIYKIHYYTYYICVYIREMSSRYCWHID